MVGLFLVPVFSVHESAPLGGAVGWQVVNSRLKSGREIGLTRRFTGASWHSEAIQVVMPRSRYY